MPHSPLTRFLAVLIVVLAAAILLWPGEMRRVYTPFILGTLPVFVAAFTWNAVRWASPFNEYGFHRTLPGGNGGAFRRVLGIHALLFGGILLGLLVYAALFNIRWPDLAYALAVIFLPLTAFCGLIGTLATLATAGSGWRIPAWLGLLFAYAGSAVLLWWLRLHEARQQAGPPVYYYFSGDRCAWAVAALLFPCCWCLAALCRRKLAALLAVVTVSALLPWISAYGNFMKVPAAAYERPVTTLSAIRKPLPADLAEWPELSRMLDLGGLQEGESAKVGGMEVAVNRVALFQGELVYRSPRRAGFPELPEEAWPKGATPPLLAEGGPPRFLPWVERQASAWYGKSKGQAVWGEAGVWQHLRNAVPAHRSFELFDNRGWAGPIDMTDGPRVKLGCMLENERPSALAQRLWHLNLEGPLRWEPVGSYKAASGGRFRLRQGGVLRADPLVTDYGHVKLYFRYRGAPFPGSFPWFGEPQESAAPRSLMLLMVDESGTRAFALGETQPESRKFLLGDIGEQVWTLWPEDWERVKLLQGGTVYVFQAVWSRTEVRSFNLLPPPP